MCQHIKAAASVVIKLFMKQKAVTLPWWAIGRTRRQLARVVDVGLQK